MQGALLHGTIEQGTIKQAPIKQVSISTQLVRLSLILFSLFLIQACTKNKLSMKQDIDILPDENHGYLLLGVDTNYSLEGLRIFGKEDISLTKADLQAGSNYILIPLSAGQYYIGKAKANELVKFKLGEDHWSFSVSPGVISYVGHFSFNSLTWHSLRAEITLENNSTHALQFMEEHFSNLLAKRPLRYHGPGEDGFLEHIIQIKTQSSTLSKSHNVTNTARTLANELQTQLTKAEGME